MSRPPFQLVLVVTLLPLGVGLCFLCLGDEKSPPAQERISARQSASTAAAIAIAPPRPREPALRAQEAPRAVAEATAAAPHAHQDLAGPTRSPQAESTGAKARAGLWRAHPLQRPRLEPAIREALIARVRDRSLDEGTRLAAVVALAAERGGDYVPEVFRARFPGQDDETLAPGPIEDFETRRILTEALRDPAATVAERALLVAALGPSQGYPETATALQEAFSDSSPEVRGQVVLELATSEEPGTQDLLQRATLDPSLEVRVRAVLVLGADPAQQPVLAEVYDAEGQDRDIKAAIVVQASEHANTWEGASFLTRVLRDEADPGLRAEALAALAVAAEADPAGLRAAVGPELPRLLEDARSRAGVSASADAERVLEVLRAG